MKCRLPRSWWRRLGSVWCCPGCGTIWTLISYDEIKSWVQVHELIMMGPGHG